jgi:hypothetical protein
VKYKIEFQYKPADRERPYDEVQDQEILFEHGEFVPIPDVGDSVEYQEGDQTVARKVVSRHFGYLSGWCTVNIVVTDMSDEEYGTRLKM